MEDKINNENASTYYKIASIFALSNLSNISLCFIERRFTMVVDSHNFLELDYLSVEKILSSDELSVDSELQVYNAAHTWLSNNTDECGNISNNILLKTRLSLLSDNALEFLLSKSPTLYKREEFAATIKYVLQKRNFPNKIKSKTFRNSRYCNQNKFNIIICGGKHGKIDVNDVYSIEANNISNVNVLPHMKEGREYSAAVCLRDDVYVFGGRINPMYQTKLSVEKYSAKTNTWEVITELPHDRGYFGACSFMDNIYIIGGFAMNSCFEFNTKDRTWKEVASMNETRWVASCVVFEGRIVVSGGFGSGSSDTVQAYDPLADTWSSMPNMVESRTCHKSVAIKNKLFVVGGCERKTCEVFDSISNKFILLKSPEVSFRKNLDVPAEVVSIGSKLLVFCDSSKSILFYDVDTGVWSEESWKAKKCLSKFSCIKVPQL